MAWNCPTLRTPWPAGRTLKIAVVSFTALSFWTLLAYVKFAPTVYVSLRDKSASFLSMANYSWGEVTNWAESNNTIGGLSISSLSKTPAAQLPELSSEQRRVDNHQTLKTDPTAGPVKLPLCPDKSPIRETKVSLNLTKVTYDDIRRQFGHVMEQGGHYAPPTCKSRERVALIIPYRDRERNLHILLNNLIPFLIRQQLEFTVFVVEQTSDYNFNRCLMFNVGFVESEKEEPAMNFTCFILHDTDLIPLDNRNLYRCSDRPRHLVLSRTRKHGVERLPYRSFIGGAIALRKNHVTDSNGCSNSYYGWGLEDDDLEIRLKSHGHPITRYPMDFGAYHSLSHIHQTDNPARGKLVKTIRSRMNEEGLNTLTYTLIRREQRELYRWLLVKPSPPPPLMYGTLKSNHVTATPKRL